MAGLALRGVLSLDDLEEARNLQISMLQTCNANLSTADYSMLFRDSQLKQTIHQLRGPSGRQWPSFRPLAL
jgi:hypothetical protein